MLNKTIKFLSKKEDVGKRLDVVIVNYLDNFTRTSIKKLIELNKVKINDLVINSPSRKVKDNDKILINLHYEKRKNVIPSNIDIDIIYEDKDILIINKSPGMVVHPGAGNFSNTLVNALIFKYKKNLSDLNGETRPGIVHRIDKETSGILVIAKNNYAHSELGKQFQNHNIKRKYVALIWGVIRPLNGNIRTLISRSKKNRQLMSVSDIKGKEAITNYKTKRIFNIKDIPKISLVEFELETGRTHQIRVHMSYKGCPILGDKKYGKRKTKFKKLDKEFKDELTSINRQILHAKTLGFEHPTSKNFVNFDTDLPKDFQKILDLLKKLSN